MRLIVPSLQIPQVEMVYSIINQDPPATCSFEIAAATSKAAAILQLKTKHMVSRAYHDSLFMARLVTQNLPFSATRPSHCSYPLPTLILPITLTKLGSFFLSPCPPPTHSALHI
jgi:hypothetical protein